MLVKQRMIFARDLKHFAVLIITYVEGRVLGAARSFWASLGPLGMPGLVSGCRSDFESVSAHHSACS
jgi:hypothetical protein